MIALPLRPTTSYPYPLPLPCTRRATALLLLPVLYPAPHTLNEHLVSPLNIVWCKYRVWSPCDSQARVLQLSVVSFKGDLTFRLVEDVVSWGVVAIAASLRSGSVLIPVMRSVWDEDEGAGQSVGSSAAEGKGLRVRSRLPPETVKDEEMIGAISERSTLGRRVRRLLTTGRTLHQRMPADPSPLRMRLEG